MPSHQHRTFDIKPLGSCRACDNFHERAGVTAAEAEAALLSVSGTAVLRMLAMLGRIDPERHAQYLEWIEEGNALAEAVDEAMGEWDPERTFSDS